jgi:IS4 transposase
MQKLKSIYQLAHQLHDQIGAHYRLIGTDVNHDKYWRARAESDHAISTAKYLIQYMPRVQADIIRAVVGAHL